LAEGQLCLLILYHTKEFHIYLLKSRDKATKAVKENVTALKGLVTLEK
jgi:hypothetical protein